MNRAMKEKTTTIWKSYLLLLHKKKIIKQNQSSLSQLFFCHILCDLREPKTHNGIVDNAVDFIVSIFFMEIKICFIYAILRWLTVSVLVNAVQIWERIRYARQFLGSISFSNGSTPKAIEYLNNAAISPATAVYVVRFMTSLCGVFEKSCLENHLSNTLHSMNVLSHSNLKLFSRTYLI